MVSLALLFVDPIPLTGTQRALMLLPICLAIAVVYKALKLESLSDMVAATLRLWGTIVAGMWAVALTLWVLYALFA